MSYWDASWLLFFWSFAFVVYLIAAVAVVGDIFRDPGLRAWRKALWLLFLIAVPVVGAITYVVARGDDMTRRITRRQGGATVADPATHEVTAVSAADEIRKANQLLEDGLITQAEFERLKSTALGSGSAV